MRIWIYSNCSLFFRAATGAAASLIVEIDLFAFADIIGIRAIGFPVGLTFRSLRITFLREREAPFPPSPQRKINNSSTLLIHVYAYARERIFSASPQIVPSHPRRKFRERSMSLARRRSIMAARKKERTDNTLDNLSTRFFCIGE